MSSVHGILSKNYIPLLYSLVLYSFFVCFFDIYIVLEEPGFQCEAGRSFENAPRGSPKIFVHDTPYKTGFTTTKVGM